MIQSDANVVKISSNRHSKSYLSWVGIFLVLSTVYGWFTARAFSPGGYNSDVLYQVEQALGVEPFNDWHPPVQALVWSWLIEISGNISSFMYLQIAVLAASGFGLALYIYDSTKSRSASLLGSAIVWFPWIMTFAGMMWKDTQMMIALFAGITCVLLATRFSFAKWPLVIFAILFLVYAILVRKNAIFAVLPLVWFLWRACVEGTKWSALGGPLLFPGSRDSNSRRVKRIVSAVLIFGIFGGLVLGASTVVNTITKPEKTGQLTQVFLDDLSFTMTAADIRETPMSEGLRDDLQQVQENCARAGTGYVSDVYWRCYRPGDHPGYEAIDHADEIADLWVSHVSSHPGRYLEYRTLVYSHFLFATDYQFQANIKDNDLGLERNNPQAYQILATYVEGFGINSLGWTFQAWFWLILSGLMVVLSRRLDMFKPAVWYLSVSSVIYLVGYFPIVPAFNFRYSYWSAAAVSIAVLLWVTERYLIKNKLRRRSSQISEMVDAQPTMRTDS